MDKSFLFELLKTPSPSGHEEAIQHKWLSYMSEHVNDLDTDLAGNAIATINREATFSVLLAGHCDEIGFIVKAIDDSGFLYVEELGRLSPLPALGMEVTIHAKHGNVRGVFGANAQHHGGAKADLTMDDLFIDCGARSAEEVQQSVEIGDPITYNIEPVELLNGCIHGRGLDNRTGAFIVAEVMKRLSKDLPEVCVHGVSTVNEETNMGGAYFAGSRLKPDLAIALDVTFATDYPSAQLGKVGEVTLAGGPVLAKGAPINKKANERLLQAAEKLGISVQYELTPRTTGTDADQLRLTGDGVPIVLVSLPLRYMHAPREVVALQDIEQEIDLLVTFIKELNTNVDLRPTSWKKQT
ncbi:M20/M25/M40 family metallo-hydrolase [Shouchella sp. JSM 1781072]|uniref:M20/M25/M40 family metallo-hydrolase n=1 Tax=Shouchella sp. JSM 1781072 TaxID=3344581 RepID=UPI0035C0934A